MNFPWLDSFTIESLDERWEKAHSTAGIYIISCGRPLNRVASSDPAGIIYIGKSLCLRDRLWTYWEAQHEASGVLWDFPLIAGILFETQVSNSIDVDPLLGRSIIRVSTPIPREGLDAAERAVLFAYTLKFGEPPPLNSILPGKWRIAPTIEEILWAEQGLDPKYYFRIAR